MRALLDGLVGVTKTVMTRLELGGTLFMVAVIGVLLTSRKEGDEPDKAMTSKDARGLCNRPLGRKVLRISGLRRSKKIG